jgi:hypothetical protein
VVQVSEIVVAVDERHFFILTSIIRASIMTPVIIAVNPGIRERLAVTRIENSKAISDRSHGWGARGALDTVRYRLGRMRFWNLRRRCDFRPSPGLDTVPTVLRLRPAA